MFSPPGICFAGAGAPFRIRISASGRTVTLTCLKRRGGKTAAAAGKFGMEGKIGGRPNPRWKPDQAPAQRHTRNRAGQPSAMA
jgi:hypothetical protein